MNAGYESVNGFRDAGSNIIGGFLSVKADLRVPY